MSTEPLPMRPFSASLPMALLLAREATMRRFRPSLAEHGLTEQQWRVLRALASADQPIEVSVLAERTALLAPSVTVGPLAGEMFHFISRFVDFAPVEATKKQVDEIFNSLVR